MDEDTKTDDGVQELVDDVNASLAASAEVLRARLAARAPGKRPPPSALEHATSPEEPDTRRNHTQSLLEFVRQFRRRAAQPKDTYETRRHRNLVEFASTLARAGLGRVTEDEILLSINGLDLNERFRTEHPEWYTISDKTLERDRARCKPRIRVRMGRPRTDD